jgi:DUF2958 family protein
MKRLTKAIEAKLAKAPLGSTEGQEVKEIIVKFFDPTGSWTWYAVEGEKQPDGDWLFFGLVDGHEKEWGNFLLSELQSIRVRFGLGIERDMHFTDQFFSAESISIVSPKAAQSAQLASWGVSNPTKAVR